MSDETTTQTAETPAAQIARMQAEIAKLRAQVRDERKAANVREPHGCGCGCGAQTIRPEARYLPGHDATHKSALIRAVLAADAKGETGTQAEADLERLGWADHLGISRKAAAKKAAGKKPAAAKPAPAPKPAATPTNGDAQTADGGRIPASVAKLAGKVGRK